MHPSTHMHHRHPQYFVQNKNKVSSQKCKIHNKKKKL